MALSTTQIEPPDDVLTLLADQHRRLILTYFEDSSADDAILQELIDYICERHDEQPEQVAKKLHHVDLPRLVDAGVIEYDGRSKTIVYHGDDEVEMVMNCLTKL